MPSDQAASEKGDSSGYLGDTVSRSVEKRVALQKGEPMPTFGAESGGALSFQQRVFEWTLACFGQAIASDKVERNHRFLEESLELVQTLGCTQSEAHQLVDYVYGRPEGNTVQECGGVLVTLMALCNANGLVAELCGENELTRVYQKIDVIRAKQAAKPKHSPLSESSALTAHDQKVREQVREAVDSCDLPRAWRAKSPCQGPEEICCHRRCADELTDWIRKILRTEP